MDFGILILFFATARIVVFNIPILGRNEKNETHFCLHRLLALLVYFASSVPFKGMTIILMKIRQLVSFDINGIDHQVSLASLMLHSCTSYMFMNEWQ